MRFSGQFRENFFTKRQKSTGERVLATLPFSILCLNQKKTSWRTTGAANLKTKKTEK